MARTRWVRAGPVLLHHARGSRRWLSQELGNLIRCAGAGPLGVTAWGHGRQNACARDRAEPAGAVGPPGLAGVSGPAECGLRRQCHLPEGSRGPVSGGHRGRPRLQVPAGAAGEWCRWATCGSSGTPGCARPGCRAGCGAASRSRCSRPATRRTPTGCSPGCGSGVACSSSSTSTTSTRSSSSRASVSPRASPVASSCWGLRWLERRTYAAADHVISTNESYKAIAVERGRAGPGAGDRGPQRSGHQRDAPGPPGAGHAVPAAALAGLPRHHGPAGRRRHRARRDGRAGQPSRTHRRPGDAARLRRLPPRPAAPVPRARSRRRRDLHRPRRPGDDRRAPQRGRGRARARTTRRRSTTSRR